MARTLQEVVGVTMAVRTTASPLVAASRALRAPEGQSWLRRVGYTQGMALVPALSSERAADVSKRVPAGGPSGSIILAVHDDRGADVALSLLTIDDGASGSALGDACDGTGDETIGEVVHAQHRAGNEWKATRVSLP